MLRCFGRLALLALLLALPLQGLAAALMPFACAAGSPAAAAERHDPAQHSTQHGIHAHEAAGHDHPGDGANGDTAGHPCCHHVCTGTPAVPLLAALDPPSSYVLYATAVPPPFVPERLQRPPRA
jgi:hypothetical protein